MELIRTSIGNTVGRLRLNKIYSLITKFESNFFGSDFQTNADSNQTELINDLRREQHGDSNFNFFIFQFQDFLFWPAYLGAETTPQS